MRKFCQKINHAFFVLKKTMRVCQIRGVFAGPLLGPLRFRFLYKSGIFCSAFLRPYKFYKEDNNETMANGMKKAAGGIRT